MRVQRVDLFHAAMPLIYPWRTAYGEDAVVETVFVRMVADGREGWGEVTPLAAPCYSPEFAAGVFLTLRDWLAPAIVGVDLPTAAELAVRLAHFKGNPFAKGALDAAWWALESRRVATPLHKLWGANREESVVGADFGVMDSLEDLLKAVGQAVDAGYPRIKLKYRPGWDLPMLKAVRAQHPKQVFHIDCNSGYTLDDLPMFLEVDKLGLAMIEQPLGYDDLLDHAKLQTALDTPICLDESINSLPRAIKAIELRSCRYVNIKPARVGGLTTALMIHDVCKRANVPCWVGGMLESSLGVGFCIELSMLENFTYPADIFESTRFYRQDLCEPATVVQRNSQGLPVVRATTKPGSPGQPQWDRLEKTTVQSASIV